MCIVCTVRFSCYLTIHDVVFGLLQIEFGDDFCILTHPYGFNKLFSVYLVIYFMQ